MGYCRLNLAAFKEYGDSGNVSARNATPRQQKLRCPAHARPPHGRSVKTLTLRVARLFRHAPIFWLPQVWQLAVAAATYISVPMGTAAEPTE